MSNNLEKQMNKIRKGVDLYPNLNEGKKIDAAVNLKKSMSKCKKNIVNYLKLVENVEAHLTESPLSAESEDDDTLEQNYKANMEKINNIKIILETNKDNLTIDEKITLYVDLVKYTNYVKDYFDKKKEVIVEYL